MKRRSFMAQIGGLVGCSQLPAWAKPVAKLLPVDEIEKNLDINLAHRIKDELLWAQEKQRLLGPILGADLFDTHLDLSGYSSASLEALECLSSLEVSATIGFKEITPEAAKVLSVWNAHQIRFSRVRELCTEAATFLGCKERSSCLSFENLMSLEASCAERLVHNAEEMMFLRFQTIPSLSLARALATNQGALSLRFPNSQISPSVVDALSFHCGHRLRVTMPDKPSETVLRHFTSNSNKTITIGCSTDPREAHPDLWFIVLKENYDRWVAKKV